MKRSVAGASLKMLLLFRCSRLCPPGSRLSRRSTQGQRSCGGSVEAISVRTFSTARSASSGGR